MLEVSRKLVMLRCTKQKMLTTSIFSGIRSEEQISVSTKYEQGSSVLTSCSHKASPCTFTSNAVRSLPHQQHPGQKLGLLLFVLFSCQPQQLSGDLLRILSDPTGSKNMLLHFFILNLKVKLSSKQFPPSIVLFNYINLRLLKMSMYKPGKTGKNSFTLKLQDDNVSQWVASLLIPSLPHYNYPKRLTLEPDFPIPCFRLLAANHSLLETCFPWP